MLDWEGKTPLHLACDGGCNLFEEETDDDHGMDNDHHDHDKIMASPIYKNKPCHDTIQVLLNACPLAAVVEDQDGMTALEHAIISNASIKIVGLLQGATCRQSMKLHSYVKRRVSQDGLIPHEEPKERQANRRSQSL